MPVVEIANAPGGIGISTAQSTVSVSQDRCLWRWHLPLFIPAIPHLPGNLWPWTPLEPLCRELNVRRWGCSHALNRKLVAMYLKITVEMYKSYSSYFLCLNKIVVGENRSVQNRVHVSLKRSLQWWICTSALIGPIDLLCCIYNCLKIVSRCWKPLL